MTRTPIYAGRLERLLANLIDTLILIVPSLLFAKIGGQHSAIAMLGAFAFNLGYYTYFTAGAWQATPGKRMLGLYVIRRDGGRLHERDAATRFLAYIMPSLPLYASFIPESVSPTVTVWLSLVWFTPVLYRPDRAGVHDLLCGTRVVKGKR